MCRQPRNVRQTILEAANNWTGVNVQLIVRSDAMKSLIYIASQDFSFVRKI
jgi:hypothetical protein